MNSLATGPDLTPTDSHGWKVTREHMSVPFFLDGTDRPAFDLHP